MVRVIAAVAALLLVSSPTAAWSQAPQTNAPPGNAGIDEYLETVPGAGGDRPTRPADERASDGGMALTPAQRKRLQGLGPDGKALAEIVDATAPAPASPKAGGVASGTSDVKSITAEGRSPLVEALAAATGQDGGGGMGWALPAIMLASVIGLVGFGVLRRRSLP